MVNIGGISNVTILSRLLPGAESARVRAGFDVGPGNCLLDAWCRRAAGKPYDDGGAWAEGGRRHDLLMRRLRDEPYFRKPPPKSTGKELFNMDWLEKKLGGLEGERPPDQDVQCTLAHLTAFTIAHDVARFFQGEFEVNFTRFCPLSPHWTLSHAV